MKNWEMYTQSNKTGVFAHFCLIIENQNTD